MDLKALAELPRFGTGIGLHRMLELCREPLEGDWLSSLDAIKVTGSNGKGSVAAMAASILRRAGVTTGLYTSPHLFRLRERFAVGGEPIGDDELAAAVAWLAGRRERYEERHPGDRVGRFEALTAIAVRCFARARPAAVVAEAGIGGRYDSTRVFPGGLTALTSLDLEHTALLGASLEEIAYGKADLAADGSTLVTGTLPPEILRRLRSYARLRRLELVPAEDLCRVRRSVATEGGTRMQLEVDGRRWDDVDLALAGAHQVANARVAVALACGWLGRHRRLPAPALERAVRAGLAEVRWPCRLEKIRADPDVVVDAGHTPGAVAAVAGAVGEIYGGRRILLVTGVSRDKPISAIVSPLAAVAEEAIVTRAHHRGAPVAEVALAVRAAAPSLPLATAASVEEALAEALATAGPETLVLVAGGLFLAAEASVVLRGGDPRQLVFF